MYVNGVCYCVSRPLHTVVETAAFQRKAGAAGVTEAERETIIMALAKAPMQGVEVVGSGGVRKVRFPGRGKGKSGGYRVMTAYIGEEAPVYLLSMLSKGDRETFTDKEVEAMSAVTAEIKAAVRGRRR
jgi:hypothetical protein